MIVHFDTSSLASYRQFLGIKSLPIYRFSGREAWFPDEYADRIVPNTRPKKKTMTKDYIPSQYLFDYQRDLSRLAIVKKRFALFLDCGLGKTPIYFEVAKYVLKHESGGVLIVCPLMVCRQLADECHKFYPKLDIEIIPSSGVDEWLQTCDGKIGVTNFEAMQSHVRPGQLSCLIVDEASILKSHYGKYGAEIIRIGKGLHRKLTGTGTPAPNDRIEFANQAVFLDQFPTVNSFLAKYFINRGQTNERWELRPHALAPFYRSLSHWSIFMTNPATYGWRDNCEALPPINVHVHDVDMTEDQHAAVRKATGGLFAVSAGGITERSKFSRIAKGLDGSATLKYSFIKSLVDSWPNESTLIWCWFNQEQDILAELLPESASIDGSTPHAKRLTLIDDFKSGRRKVMISKPSVLGFGLNLQIATRQIFSSLIDSYEKYYQAVKRSNRYGSKLPLNVHLPVLDVERPMVENVLRKAGNVQRDTEEQERIFKQFGGVTLSAVGR